MNPHCSFLVFGVVFVVLLNSSSARQLPVHFFSLYDIPDDVYRDDAYYKEKKSEELQNENYRKTMQLFKEMRKANIIRDLRARTNFAKNLISDDFDSTTDNNSRETIQLPQQLDRNGIKDRTAKKNNNNNYYMSVCHFKICNMGRKRNIRHIQNVDLLPESRRK